MINNKFRFIMKFLILDMHICSYEKWVNFIVSLLDILYYIILYYIISYNNYNNAAKKTED